MTGAGPAVLRADPEPACAPGPECAPRADARRSWTAALPLVLLPAAAFTVRPLLPPWGFMAAIALAIFFGFKWLTWREAMAAGAADGAPRPEAWRSAAYLLLWPGMDARAFLDTAARPVRAPLRAWAVAFAKLCAGIALVWGGAPRVVPAHPLLGGWIGFLGLGFVFHFGGFHLLALAWQSLGVHAEPIMRAPLRAASLAELWGRRWNLAFHELAVRLLFRPLRSRIGGTGAILGVFLASGLVHELAITVPARGGYGLPTLYFLVQGIGILIERARQTRLPAAARGVSSIAPPGAARDRLFALLVAAGPAVLLFPPPFIEAVVLPLLGALGAVKGA